MKTMFKFHIVMALLVAVPAVAGAQQALTSVAALLGTHFHASQRVGYVRLRFDANNVHVLGPQGQELGLRPRAAVERHLHEALPRSEYTVFVARTGSRIDGYMIEDQERGQHEPIDFATFTDAHGAVTRVEILAYREAYGDGVREARFRDQFRGRTAESGFRVGEDVDVIGGASISSRSVTMGVERATALVSALVSLGDAIAAR